MKSRFDKKKVFRFHIGSRLNFNSFKVNLKNVVPFSPIISETVKAPTHLLENSRQVPLVELGLLLRLRRTWVHTDF